MKTTPTTQRKPNIFKRAVLGLLAVCIVGFVAIQLVPVSRTNPPVVSEPNWDSPETRTLAVRACFDCHSNETRWPWYAYVAPVSWLVARDVSEARDKLNFSNWASSGREARGMAREVQRGQMPPANYLMLHPDARLSDAEKQALINGLTQTARRAQASQG